ncbi:hsp70-binding protein 1 isoform X2 [Callorhinchus milii]|uniref:Hsp70-binding protein 1 n=2 Tax=Callorhinchus milii TaxID=7868 RepID=A0A4W3J3J5_CALMI|nr:hsp70-binding protein 1 isoform X2 [Callorhinchus milii]XP_042200837.1 hsp70-binding protein 1 isoform X2 [Callorhinchus milii]|eukprot:gi/632982456/ref/XP_007908146.1/ PREDICTED: hsp70-binding protein 1 isoform X1 [Callorhinchus milii]
MANGGSDRDRHPQNLQGLLRLSVEAGTVGDGVPELHPMAEQRRQWLQDALSDAFDGQLDELKQIKQCLQILYEPPDEDTGGEGRKERALDLVADLCENLDNARDFCKLDGMKLVVETLLQCADPELRWRSANIIGTCSQNNPFVQQCALGLGAIQILLDLLNNDENDLVRIKALFAVSCLVREQEAGLQEFVDHDGFSVLMRAMQSRVEKLKVKAAFLLQNLLGSHPEHKEVLCSMGMVQQLVSLIQAEHEAFHEHVLGALYSLVSHFPRGVKQCKIPELGLENILMERVRMLKNQEEFQEELDFCEKLLQTCFSGQSEENGMDR